MPTACRSAEARVVTRRGQPGRGRAKASARYRYEPRRQKLNRARFYQPSIGRFSQEDPLGPGVTAKLYAYVASMPIMFGDPEGLYEPGQVLCRGPRGSTDFSGADIVIVVSDGNGGSYRGPLNGKVRIATFGRQQYGGKPDRCRGALITNVDPVRPSPRTPHHSADPYAGFVEVKESPHRMTGPVSEAEIQRRTDEWNSFQFCYGDDKICSDFVWFVLKGKKSGAPSPPEAFCK